MFNKALLLKDYKQSKFIVWAFWLVSFFLPFKVNDQVKSVEYSLEHWEEWGNTEPYHFYFSHMFSDVSIFQIIIVISLASILIGLERTNQSLDFTLSLPYKRRDILLSKWILGVTNIIIPVTISALISYFIVKGSVMDEFLPDPIFLYYYLTALSVLIGIYTFSLFMGLVGASVLSQFVLSWIFLFLPYGLWMLIEEGIGYHYLVFTQNHFYLDRIYYSIFTSLSIPITLFEFDRDIMNLVDNNIPYDGLRYLLIPVGVTIISFVMMMVFANQIRSENNGKILVHPGFEPFFKVGVFICFYLLGGAMAGSMSYGYEEIPTLSSYHIGGLITSVLVYYVLSKLMGFRLQVGKRT